MRRLIQSLLLFCLLLTTTAPPLSAATIELPLFLRIQILQNALVESLTPQPDRPTVLFQEGSYNYLHISEPQLSIRDGQPYFSCNATAGMGFDSLGVLPSVIKWSGSILLRLSFYVDPQWQLRYRIVDSAIYNEKGGKPVVTGFAWELSKRFLHPRLEQYGFDLAMPQKEITSVLRACASPTDTVPLETALSTLTVGTLHTKTNGLVVPLLLTVTDAQTKAVAPLPAQAPLGFEELEKLQHIFEPLDAFLVFTIKNISTNMEDTLHQEQLFDLLITSRYQLLMILTGQTPMEAEDPLRVLFSDAWEQLRLIVESSSGKKGLMQKQLLRYMTFINAGDALLTLDNTAPGLGIHLTSDGLRRLARMLQPGSEEDPLRFDWQIDPALRDLFKFQAEPEAQIQDLLPEPTPEPSPTPVFLPDPTKESPPDFPPESAPVPTPDSTPNSIPESTPKTAPETIIEQDLEPIPSPVQGSSAGQYLLNPTNGISAFRRLIFCEQNKKLICKALNFLVGVAHAEKLPPMPASKESKRLERWVPTAEEHEEYEKLITRLLKTFTQTQLTEDPLEPRYAKIYQSLVPATAMIESCWQQFERQDDKIIPLRSQAGGIGIMQVNQHVWRGFYNMERLQGDVAYNIQAGNQILLRYFKQYGIKVAKENNKPGDAARATYAAYNGGPRAVRRFMKPDASARQKRVDEHLWDLYQKAAAGGRGDLATCSIL